MAIFNILATGDVLSEKHINIIVKAYSLFYNNLTPKHQAKIKLNLLSRNTISDQANYSAFHDTGCNINIVTSDDPEKNRPLFKEASILFIPVMGTPSPALRNLLICGVPILCHHKSELRKHTEKQFTLYADNSNVDTAYNDEHAIEDYASLLETLYFDSTVQKILKKKADKKYRRKMNSNEKGRNQTKVEEDLSMRVPLAVSR